MTAPRLDLTHIASFLALVETGGFSVAARRLGLSQAAVSQHVRRLEDCLAVPLINRDRSGCTPTEAATRFLPIARSLMAIEARAVEVLSATTLRLGACSNIGVYVLPALIRDFAAAGGAVPPLAIASNPATAAALERAEIDLALMEWWDDRPGFFAERWRHEAVVAIAAPGHAWAAEPFVSIEDLAVAPLIGGEPGTGTGRLLRHHLTGTRELPQPVLKLGSTEAVKRAVMARLGVSVVLALSVLEEKHNGSLVVRPLKPALQKPLWLIWRNKGSALSSAADLLRRSATPHAHQQRPYRHLTKVPMSRNRFFFRPKPQSGPLLPSLQRQHQQDVDAVRIQHHPAVLESQRVAFPHHAVHGAAGGEHHRLPVLADAQHAEPGAHVPAAVRRRDARTAEHVAVGVRFVDVGGA